jgi:hypothetical protein
VRSCRFTLSNSIVQRPSESFCVSYSITFCLYSSSNRLETSSYTGNNGSDVATQDAMQWRLLLMLLKEPLDKIMFLPVT